MIEAVASDPDIPRSKTGLDTPGYRSLWVADLMVDYDPRTSRSYAFMSSSFEKTYPLVIWALKFHMADELFDVPQAGLVDHPEVAQAHIDGALAQRLCFVRSGAPHRYLLSL